MILSKMTAMITRGWNILRQNFWKLTIQIKLQILDIKFENSMVEPLQRGTSIKNNNKYFGTTFLETVSPQNFLLYNKY